jgi:hypothetical protein
MDSKTALQTLDWVAQQYKGTRSDHVRLQEAIDTLDTLIKKNAEPGKADKPKDSKNKK